MKHILIAHRGNIAGPQPELENTIPYIENALRRGFNCEVDVWWNEGWWLGHDAPTHQVDFDFLVCLNLWVHLKDIQSVERMIYEERSDLVNYFWHQNDDIAITNQQWIWTYPGKPLTTRSIAVLPEAVEGEWEGLDDAGGICSDYIGRYV